MMQWDVCRPNRLCGVSSFAPLQQNSMEYQELLSKDCEVTTPPMQYSAVGKGISDKWSLYCYSSMQALNRGPPISDSVQYGHSHLGSRDPWL